MSHDIDKGLTLGGLGLAYGCALAFIGFLAAGFGHGCYVIIGLSSAPLGLLQNILISLIGGPVLWTVVGLLLGTSRHLVLRLAFLATMLSHYASLFHVLRSPSIFADWDYLPKVQSIVWIGFAVYAIGQALIWIWYVGQFYLSKKPE